MSSQAPAAAMAMKRSRQSNNDQPQSQLPKQLNTPSPLNPQAAQPFGNMFGAGAPQSSVMFNAPPPAPAAVYPSTAGTPNGYGYNNSNVGSSSGLGNSGLFSNPSLSQSNAFGSSLNGGSPGFASNNSLGINTSNSGVNPFDPTTQKHPNRRRRKGKN